MPGARDLPNDFVKSINAQLGDNAAGFFDALEEPPIQAIRLPKKHASKGVIGALPWDLRPVSGVQNGFILPSGAKPGRHLLYHAGAYYPQESSAIATANLLEIDENDFTLDLCAAPGGKASILCEKTGEGGLFVANEPIPKRAAALRENLERLGLGKSLILSETPERLSARFVRFFDKILVDAPCSGEGMFRKNPESISQWSIENVRMCHERQVAILRHAALMLRPGGRILYSTCTFNQLENEGSVERFLDENEEFAAEKTVRIWPHKAAGEGHFACLLAKDGGKAAKRDMPKRVPPPSGVSGALTKTLSGIVSRDEHERIEVFGSYVCAVQENMPDLGGLRVVSAGLQLMNAKSLPEPAHALAMAWDSRFERMLDMGEAEAEMYLAGEALQMPESCGVKGYMPAAYMGCVMGWCKAVPGRAQNRLPKGLRMRL